MKTIMSVLLVATSMSPSSLPQVAAQRDVMHETSAAAASADVGECIDDGAAPVARHKVRHASHGAHAVHAKRSANRTASAAKRSTKRSASVAKPHHAQPATGHAVAHASVAAHKKPLVPHASAHRAFARAPMAHAVVPHVAVAANHTVVRKGTQCKVRAGALLTGSSAAAAAATAPATRCICRAAAASLYQSPLAALGAFS